MIGSRSEESGFMEAVQEKRAHRPDILFIPRLSREWMAAAIQAANVVVLAANGEGSPITILEAMSHKKPWLATPEYSEAKTQLGGFTCEWRNLKDYLQALKDHPQWCDELGVVGFEHWRQHHSWPVAVQGWVDLIEYEKLRNPLVFDINQVSRMARIRGELFGVLPEESREPFHEPTLYLGEVAGVDPQTLAAAYNGSLELVRLVEIAQVLTERGELSGVAALYRAWIEHSDSHLRFAALYNLGTVLEGTGDTEGARQAYAGALNFNPKFEMARIALMRLQ
jgi:tetratricopeptide (TPR) repeat protein